MRLLPQNADEFQKITAAFQSLVLAVGLIITGVWGGSAFYNSERAKAELEQIQKTIHRTGLDVTVDAKQEALDPESGRYLGIKVTVENKGNNAVRLGFDQKPPLRVSRVRFDLDHDGPPTSFGPQIGAQVYADLQPDNVVLDKDLLPSEIYQYSTLVHVREPGVYFVLFEAAVGVLEPRGISQAKGQWLASTYTIVQ